MFVRFEYGRLRSAENLASHPTPMAAMHEQESYGDLSQGRQYRYRQGGDSDLEAQNVSQHVPLLSASASREQLYNPARDYPPCLPPRDFRESFRSSPNTASTSGGAVESMKLFRGILVLDCPVPPQLLGTVPESQRDLEFTHMRYTAATCKPTGFSSEGFTLRQPLSRPRRRTELYVVVTMYNEEDFLFARTMAGIFQNIHYMCRGKGSNDGSWDADGWKRIVVCVVSDGRAQLNSRTAAVVTALGVYQKGIMAQKVGPKDVTAHIYEYTTKVGIEVNRDIVETKPGMDFPAQMIFCLKEKNQRKINSHRWALEAFGPVLEPEICILLDAGTRPGPDSTYHLWLAFKIDTNCAGACGEIKAFLGKNKRKLLNPLVAAQNFEYKMSNILDKPMESAFSFISVLPGAFSAYRFKALQNGPLEKYFAGEKMSASSGIFSNNMYLAEDRVLCFELVAKPDAKWVLAYVQSAKGETDVPEEMPELINQRRRWLNGSFFASLYALAHFYKIFNSGHSNISKAFMIEFLYQLVSLLFSWFAVGNFFLVFQILTTSLGGLELLGNTGEVLSVIIEILGYLFCFIPWKYPGWIEAILHVHGDTWATIMIYLTFAAIFIAVRSIQIELADEKFTFSKMFSNSVFFTLIVSLISTYILWIFISIVFLDPWHIVTSSLQYLLLSPTYINVINVFALCNTHDISWGTKKEAEPDAAASLPVQSNGDVDVNELGNDNLHDHYDSELQKFSKMAVKIKKTPSSDEQDKNKYKSIRSYVVLFWMFSNGALIAVVLKVGGLNRLDVAQPTNPGEPSTNVAIYLQVILWSVAAMSAFKFVGAMWYQIIRTFRGDSSPSPTS